MLRAVFLALFIVIVSYGLKVYVENFKASENKRGEIVNFLEGIRIKMYSKKGVEWTLKGESMKAVNDHIELLNAMLFSQEATLKAQRAYINRSSGKGELHQDVELVSKDLVARSQKVYMDIKEDRFYGDGKIQVVEGGKKIEGEGFEIKLKPLRVEVYKARSIVE